MIGEDDLSAGSSQGIGASRVDVLRCDHEHGRGVERAEELGVQRQASLAVEDDAEGLTAGVRASGGKQRVIGEDRADADGDRVGFGAPAVNELLALGAGDPGRVAGGGLGLSVK